MIQSAILLAALVTQPTLPSPSASQQAKAAFEKGRRLFAAEEHALALGYFRLAYELSNHRPSATLALAQCERALGNYDDALEHLREYTATERDEDKRASAAETIAIVEELAQLAKSRPPAPPTQPFEPAVDPDHGAPWWAVGLGVIAALGLAGSGVALGVAFSETDPAYGGSTGAVLGEGR